MARAAAAFLGLALGVGCAHQVRTDRTAPDGAAARAGGEVMSAQDHARVEAVAAERANGGGDVGYRIGPEDLLEIRIPDLLDTERTGLTQLAGQGVGPLPSAATAPVVQGLRVDAGGNVSLPLIGLVRAEGLTPTELERDIARRLTAAQILRAPQVSVQVAEYRSRVVAVIGSVERPGLYPVTRPRATLADLIWAAGGPTREAGRLVDFVPASASDPVVPGAAPDPTRLAHGQAIRVDLEMLLHATEAGSALPTLQVRPGDLISLAPAGNVQVDGWVDKPGSYPVTRGLTLSGAVAAAGGRLFPADLRRATVKRRLSAGEERHFTVDLEQVATGAVPDVPIADGDVVRLPASPARVVPYAAWQVVQALVRVGGSVPLF